MGACCSKPAREPPEAPLDALETLRREVGATRHDVVTAETMHRAAKRAYVRALNSANREQAHDKLQAEFEHMSNDRRSLEARDAMNA